MKRYTSFILIVLLGISMTGFSRNNNRNNNERSGNYNNNGNGSYNNSRPGGNPNPNNRPNNPRPENNRPDDRNPGGNYNNRSNNNIGKQGTHCVEKRKNSDQCIKYENYNGGQLPSRPPKL